MYTIETKNWSTHWTIKVFNQRGGLVTCHTGKLNNQSYKRGDSQAL